MEKYTIMARKIGTKNPFFPVVDAKSESAGYDKIGKLIDSDHRAHLKHRYEYKLKKLY